MSERDDPAASKIEWDVELAEPPQKVWRALSIAAFRDRWLPPENLASPEPVSSLSGRELSYRMREPQPPFRESVVTFRIAPNEAGGTRLTILHELTDARATLQARRPANANAPSMRAA